MSALASAFERATSVEPLGNGAWSATLWSRDGVLLAQSRQLGLLLADPR